MNTNNNRPGVRCGAAPDTSKQMYKLTTDDIEKFINSKFNYLESRIKKEVSNRGGNPNDVPHINVKVINSKFSDIYVAFGLILPDDILDYKRSDPNTPSVFCPEDEDEGVKLKKPYYELLRSWAYSKEDINYFRSSSFRSTTKIKNMKNINDLIRYSKPKVETISDSYGKTKWVIQFMDPIKIIHDMLVDSNNETQRFRCFVESSDGISDGKFIFTISREVVKKKKGEEEDIIRKMRRVISSDNRRH